MPAKRKAVDDTAGRSSKRGTPAPSTPQNIDSDDDFSGSDAASQDDADDSEKEHIRNYRKKLDFASFQGSKRAANHPVFGEKDWSWMKLKPDHNNRPIWIDPNVSTHSTKGPKITMESFSPLATQATDLLTTIAEPQSRPQFMHEYRFTEHSLYAALSVGLRGEDIISALEKLSKTPVPQPVIDFINRHTKTYGKVRMVLRDNKWFVESEDHDLLQLLQNDPVIGPCCASGLQSGTIQTKAAVIQGTKESRGMQQAQYQPAPEGQPEERTDVQVLMDSLRDEDDEDQDDTTYTNWFEILPHERDTVAKQCLDIGYPAVAEYDFINDHVNPELSIDLRASTSIRPYQEKALSKMFGNGRGKSGIIVLPCGAGKTLVGITAGCHIKKSIVVLCTSAMSAHQWAGEFRKWSDISEDDIAVFSATEKRKFKGAAGVLVTTYSMITARGKRAHDTQQMLNWVYGQDWGLMILDEVHVVPAKMFRQVGSNIRAHCKLGLTATLLREDDKITDLNFLIGPKLYEANWMELADQGHIAKVQCAEVWCAMSMEFYEEYQKEKGKKRALYYMMNPVKFQYCQYLINFHEKRGDKIIVFSDNLFALYHYAKTLNRSFIHGGTSNQERIQVLENFQHNDKINTLFLSKIGDTSLDLPEATCLIQISSHYGSRRQEAQRLGRILRAKRRNDEGFNAFFYSLVSKDTTEMVYSAKRQAFLVDQGYAFKTITHLAGMEKLPDLKYVDLRSRLELLADVKMKTDTDAEVEAVKDDNWSHLHIAVGMKPKKIHEVSNFASFVNDLSNSISQRSGEPIALVDFGSGQNYLGRTLACPPYNKDIIAIEKKHHNVQGAQDMDIHARLAKKEKIMRNKKEYKRRLAMPQGLPIPPLDEVDDYSVDVPAHVLERLALEETQAPSSDRASYKIPSLQPNHPRLVSTSTAYDPHGFPMSKALEEFPLPDGGKGVRLNITARMMAVQAPYNWGREDSEMFFTRHFYRALLQRILLDRGIDKRDASSDHVVGGNSLSAKDDVRTPLIVGSLRKSCFTSFRAYVRGALNKLGSDLPDGALIREVTSDLSDEVIAEYESKYAYAKKNLSIMWTLMAFSAGVVESIITVDRWLYLKQQDCVKDAWVQPLFDYEQSPRNLCVVAVKKTHEVDSRKPC
ncbi:hypothetical protein DV737_g1260, partial [Chaetothyriales sp. CBS 132003]